MELVKSIIEEFAPRFAPGSALAYARDNGAKWGHFGEDSLRRIGVQVDSQDTMPDVVLHCAARNWLLLVESVTSNGPMNSKRRAELVELFAGCPSGLVFVAAFPNRSTMRRYLSEIAWGTEVWLADAPSHLIHFNGERFLGPYDNV